MMKVALIFAVTLNCVFVRSIDGRVVEARNNSVTDGSSSGTYHGWLMCIDDYQYSQKLNESGYPARVQQLHTEIEQFVNYMQPTSIERSVRLNVKARIETIVQDIWPDAQLQFLGSSIMGLALPTSDIDLNIYGASGQSPFQLLASKILESEIAEKGSLLVKCNTRVPIIEFIDRASQINIDLSLFMYMDNILNLKADHTINEFQERYSVLRKLMIVLKYHLKQRDLNESSTGGISSYALTLMCISFLQKHPTYKPNGDSNLGELLLDFFRLYGREFDFENTGISVLNGGKHLPREMMPCDRTALFCIENPTEICMNVCYRTHRASEIKQAFDDAYTTLSMTIATSHNNTSDCSENSILGKVVQVSNGFQNYRKWIQDNFESSLPNEETGDKVNISNKPPE